jgi:hypothetical protein
MGDIPLCGNACWQCKSSATAVALNKPIFREGLRIVMIDIMIHRSLSIEKLELKSDGLAKTMASYKDSNGVPFTDIIFGPRCRSQSEPLCRALILRLFACGMLIPAIDQKRLYAKLAVDETGTPVVNDDTKFDGITLIAIP